MKLSRKSEIKGGRFSYSCFLSKDLKEKITSLQKCPTCLQEVNEQYKKIISQKVDEELSSIIREDNENLLLFGNLSVWLKNHIPKSYSF